MAKKQEKEMERAKAATGLNKTAKKSGPSPNASKKGITKKAASKKVATTKAKRGKAAPKKTVIKKAAGKKAASLRPVASKRSARPGAAAGLELEFTGTIKVGPSTLPESIKVSIPAISFIAEPACQTGLWKPLRSVGDRVAMADTLGTVVFSGITCEVLASEGGVISNIRKGSQVNAGIAVCSIKTGGADETPLNNPT
jgi:predicted deacylase